MRAKLDLAASIFARPWFSWEPRRRRDSLHTNSDSSVHRAAATAFASTRGLGAACVVAVTTGALLLAPPAFAGNTNLFTTTFGAANSTPPNPYPLSNPSDVAVDTTSGPSAGDIYVTDPSNNRIEKFNAAGEFLLMFGRGVVPAGAAGTGDLTTGSSVVASAMTTEKQFLVGQTLTGDGIPSGTTITAVEESSLTLSQAATKTATDVALTVAEGAGNVANNEVQTINITGHPTGGTFTLAFGSPRPSSTLAITDPIPYDATAAELEDHLTELSNVGTGNISVIGPAGGPWKVEFKGRYADTNVRQLNANGTELDPPVSVKVGVLEGHSEPQVCTAASGAICQLGEESSSPGALMGTHFIAVDNSSGPSKGDVYVGDVEEVAGTITKFDEDGELITTWGDDGPEGQPNGQLSVQNGWVDGTNHPSIWAAGPMAFVGMAVDSSGNFFVISAGQLDYANYETLLARYEQDGSPYTAFSIGGPTELLAVDPEDNFYSASTIPHELGPVTGLAVDSESGALYVVEEANGGQAYHYKLPLGEQPEALNYFGSGHLSNPGGIALDADGDAYVANTGAGDIAQFDAAPVPNTTIGPVKNPGQTSVTLTGEVEPAGGPPVTKCEFQYGTSSSYKSGSVPCSPEAPYESPTRVSANLTGLAAETTYYYRIVASNELGSEFSKGQTFTLHNVAELETKSATDIGYDSAVLNGSFLGNGENTTFNFECVTQSQFEESEWADSFTTEVQNAGSPTGSTPVEYHLGEYLEPVTTYECRIVAENAVGATHGLAQRFETLPAPPTINNPVSTEVHSDGATLHAQINPGGGVGTYRFEYVSAEQFSKTGYAEASRAPIPDGQIAASNTLQGVSVTVTGLERGTTYHWRVVASNVTEVTVGPDQTLNTFRYVPIVEDPCSNAHVRQQTSAAFLLDCRAYELVSAANSGGYPVESGLVAGEQPLPGYPDALNPPRVLYAVHDGAIPGTGNPTNDGLDPYVASRGENGWTTTYVGIPANGTPAHQTFASPLAEADPTLDTFAFGGSGLCKPCFSEGIETGIPLRLSDGKLVQGMAPTAGIEPGPSASPDGYIAADFSANGEHFIFGSTSQFAPGGNDETGDVSIYDHNLKTGETHAISNDPAGAPLTCLQGAGNCDSANHDSNGIAELAISKNGSHILLGQKVTDADGNVYWHPYMNVGDSEKTIDLLPRGTSGGILFDGMTEDGTQVFLSSEENLTAEDESHTGASIYMWSEKGEGEGRPLTLVSTGNSSSCDPVSNKISEHWNTVGSTEDCGVLAIGGGGGVAPGSGSIYFLSPEKLDGSSNGTENQPNLYLAQPGATPRFIATLNSEDPLVIDALSEAEIRHTADFQVSPSGEFAAFPTTAKLSDYDNGGDTEIYRYAASSDGLHCVSCDPTNALAAGDASLASNGLSLTEDGQLFFNSTDALTPSALNQKQNVYEWEPHGTGNCGPESPTYSLTDSDCLALISTGISRFDSSLLSASANGIDVYFFTRDTLVPQDQNGELAKIYDARAGGGFPYLEPAPLCKSSDECHGPGSSAPEPPSIQSTAGVGEGNNPTIPSTRCQAGRHLKHGKCVKAHRYRKHRQSVHRQKHRGAK